MVLENSVKDFFQLLKSKTGKDTLMVFIGNVLALGLGFLAIILITRTLRPLQFGLFSVAMAAMGIASQFSEIGVGTTLIRFVSLFLRKDELKANLILKVGLKFNLIIAAITFLIGFLLSKLLAVNLFNNPNLIFPFKLAFIGAFGTSLVGYILASFQARQSFKNYIFIKIIPSLGKFVLIGLLFLTLKLNFSNALITVIILPFIALLIGSLIMPKNFLRAKGNEKEIFKEMFRFSKWIMVSIFCSMIFTRLDVLMLEYFKTSEIVGYYSAAFQLAGLAPLITMALTVVLLPKVSGLNSNEQFKNYIKKVLKYSSLIVLILLPIVLIAKPLIITLYGVQYLNSVNPFRILYLALITSIIFNPIGLVLYAINKPDVSAYANLGQLILTFGANYLLIPLYGAIGAAITVMLAQLLGGGFVFGYVCAKIFSNKGY